ncbi:MAG: efflux RND transporter periplasmic adaptor subunit [Saprospiraceae bacterium]
MKSIINAVLVVLFLAGCSGEKIANQNKDKKTLLAEKQAELKQLESDIIALQAEVNAENPSEVQAPVQVNATFVTPRDFKRFADLQALVTTDNVISLGSDIGGRILKIYVKEGQKVGKGQLVATVDAESIEKQKEELQKSLDLAVDVYDRQKRLWDQNIGSEVQYLQAKNNKERLEKSIATIESQLRKKNVYAPIAGVVDKQILKEGEIASPGMPIVSVINVSKVKVVADVPEIYLGKVKVGDKVTISFPALGKEIVKPITLIGNTIDPNNRTFKLEAQLDNYSGELKPNLLSIYEKSMISTSKMSLLTSRHYSARCFRK